MPLTRRSALLGLPLALAACGGGGTDTELPPVALPPLPGVNGRGGWPAPGFSVDEFRRGVAVLNVWASWCPYCQAEHEHLFKVARDTRVRLLGLVSRDTPAKAAAYLQKAGNPYAAVAVDDGRLGKALGARGVPSTFVVEANGRIHARISGALDDSVIAERLRPAIERALARRSA